jgi:hypothetical protein
MSMYVLKRNGRRESVHFDKITSRVSKLCYGLDAKVGCHAPRSDPERHWCGSAATSTRSDVLSPHVCTVVFF